MSLVRRIVHLVAQNWGRLKWLVAVAVLAFLFAQHWDGLRRLDWRRVDWALLGVALVALAMALSLSFVRWYLLVWAQDFPFGLRDALRLGMIGYLFNYVAPGAIGGDLVKASLIAREQPVRRWVAVGTVLIDRLVGFLGLLIVGAAAVLIPTATAARPEFQPIRLGFWIGTAAGIVGLAAALHPAVVHWQWLNRLVHWRYVGRIVAELLNSARLYQARSRVLVAAVALSCLVHLGLTAAFYFCALALHDAGTVPSFVEHLQFVPAANLFGIIIPVPAGVGALEGAMAYFYRLAGSSADKGFLTAIAYRGLTVVVAVVGSGYYITSRREIRQAVQDAPPPTPETMTAEASR